MAVLMVIGWLLGFFFLSLGGVIHILLVFAFVSVMLGAIRSENI
jgi:hypothetical protein